jgi:hypothetical protein
MKKLIVTDPVQICGSDLIGSVIRNFGWEVRMYGIWQKSGMKAVVKQNALLSPSVIGEQHQTLLWANTNG